MHAKFGKRDGGFLNVFATNKYMETHQSTKSLPVETDLERDPYENSHSYPCSPRTLKQY